MAIAPQLLFGKVMHARLMPKQNYFKYGIYYLNLPLSQLQHLPIAHNRFSLLSFYDTDHGHCDGSNIETWARTILTEHKITSANGEITLLCMPRVLGYVFNPVSFWLCYDKEQQLRAVICEVHNTFGERHSYLCANADQHVITSTTTLTTKKLFHVSPFLAREGYYQFRFDISNEHIDINIDFYNADNHKQLVTALSGDLKLMTPTSLRKAFRIYPLVTFKAITLIHWQALKLLLKGIKYIAKPKQKQPHVSTTNNITKI